MINASFAEQLLIVFALATLVLFLFQKARIPSIVGFLFTGALTGPHGLGLVTDTASIDAIAELGVILLLFTIGLEFSMKTLFKIRRTVLIGGGLQVALTGSLSYLFFKLYGFADNQAVFYGFLTALSSTAIAMKMMQERGEVDTQQGRAAMGILIFQDLVAVPMLLIIPMLAGKGMIATVSVTSVLAKALAIIVLIIVSSRYLIPWILHEIARTGNRELFLLSIFLIVFTIAWFTSWLGLSLALGAFLAGLIISESDYSHQALGNMMPFRDLFTSFFFVSIGMLLNTSFLLNHPVLVVSVTVLVLLLKTVVSGFATFLIGYPIKAQVIVGLSLSQIGEFSFILAGKGRQVGLFEDTYYQLFLNVAIFSMAFTPLMISLAPKVQRRASKMKLPSKILKGIHRVDETSPDVGMVNHTIIIGLGLNGQNVAQVTSITGIPYVIVDSVAEQVQHYKELGVPVIYGDAASEAVLRAAGIERASIAVVAIADAPTTYAIIQLARELNPSIHIIVRTRFTRDVEYLYMIGASEVIPEEFETSVEIFARVLNRYLFPRNEIESIISTVRSGAYEVFRKTEIEIIKPEGISNFLPDLELSAVRIEKNSEAEGTYVSEIKLRRRFGLTMVALRRNNCVMTDMNADEILLEGDIVYLLGSKIQLTAASMVFRGGE